jgi:hypothetical protein
MEQEKRIRKFVGLMQIAFPDRANSVDRLRKLIVFGEVLSLGGAERLGCRRASQDRREQNCRCCCLLYILLQP